MSGTEIVIILVAHLIFSGAAFWSPGANREIIICIASKCPIEMDDEVITEPLDTEIEYGELGW
jgi:hypothetical protein